MDICVSSFFSTIRIKNRSRSMTLSTSTNIQMDLWEKKKEIKHSMYFLYTIQTLTDLGNNNCYKILSSKFEMDPIKEIKESLKKAFLLGLMLESVKAMSEVKLCPTPRLTCSRLALSWFNYDGWWSGLIFDCFLWFSFSDSSVLNPMWNEA